MAAAPTTVSSYVKRFEGEHIPASRTPKTDAPTESTHGRRTPPHTNTPVLSLRPILTNTEDTLGAHAETAHAQLLKLLHAVDTVERWAPLAQ